jgi:hypothetical protein
MNSRKKTKLNLIFPALIFVLISAAVFLAVKYVPTFRAGDADKNNEEIKNAVFYKDIDINKLSLAGDGDEYSLKNGEFFRNGNRIDVNSDNSKAARILRLALFYKQLAEEPVLFSINIDSQELGSSIDSLKVSREKLLENGNKNGKTVGTKEAEKLYGLFPVSFLEAFQESSEQFKKFSGDISENNAAELLKLIDDTSVKYGENISGLKNNFDEYTNSTSKSNSRLMFLGGKTLVHPEIYGRDLTIMQKNHSAISEKISRLKKCLNISAEFCERPVLTTKIQKDQSATPAADNTPTKKILSKKELGIDGLTDISGPYGVSSPCWGDNNIHYIYNWPRCINGNCFEWSVLADDAFFRKTSDKFAEDKKWIAKKIPIVPLNPTSPYSCNDLEYKPALEAMDYFYKKYGGDMIFEKILAEGVPEKLRSVFILGSEAERSFFDAKYPDSVSFKKLSDSYRQAYATAATNMLFGQKERQELLDRYIVSAEKMVNFHMILNRVIMHLNSLARKIQLNDTALDVFYLYGARNNYSLLFMNFSPFMWVAEEHPSYLEISDEAIRNDLSKMDAVIDHSGAIIRFGERNITKWQKEFIENKEFIGE